jgi:glutathione synthase/RimK-type ligase-like ATP-grasp enzyme
MSPPAETAYLGLAPFLRLNIASNDLRPIAQALLKKAGQEEENANLWMNLSTAFFCIGQREHGLLIQDQALGMQRSYQIPAAIQPTRFRLLVVMVAGDIAENTPIDCLLEGGAVDLLYYYATAAEPLPESVPEHDALLVAIADGEANRPVLQALTLLLADWPKPVINTPQHIPNTGRDTASALLQQVDGLFMPPTRQIGRDAVLAIACGKTPINDVFHGCQFPIILRPVGSQAGRDLARIDDIQGIADYLTKVNEPRFFLSPFIDYSGEDGMYRKFRIALIAGQPFACHMGISAHWMIHYLNAGMYENAEKRAEEARFMDTFAAFAERHQAALASIYQRAKLDYLCIDCAETQNGELLIFEMDHVMVVHAMDPEDLFPYKQVHMGKVKQAFEDYLVSLATETVA